MIHWIIQSAGADQLELTAIFRALFIEKPNAPRAEFSCVRRGVFALCHKGHPWRALLSGKHGAVHGYIYEGATVTKTSDFLSILKDKAVVPYCPRPMLHNIPAHRKSTKTPPGYKDQGNGDFFIWADLLYGLRKLQLEGGEFLHVVLVTNDTKKDWSREGKAHPIPAAEISALHNATFETWTLEKLIKEIERAVE